MALNLYCRCSGIEHKLYHGAHARLEHLGCAVGERYTHGEAGVRRVGRTLTVGAGLGLSLGRVGDFLHGALIARILNRVLNELAEAYFVLVLRLQARLHPDIAGIADIPERVTSLAFITLRAACWAVCSAASACLTARSARLMASGPAGCVRSCGALGGL